MTIETRDDLTATGFAQIFTPREVHRLGLPVMPDAFLVAVARRCGRPHVCLCMSLGDAVAMLTALNIDTLQILCTKPEEPTYIAFAECQAAADRMGLH